MKTITLDGPTVDRLISAAVDERGARYAYKDSYQDVDCMYYVTDAYAAECKSEYNIDLPTGPACLVGKIFHDLDSDIDGILLEHNEESVMSVFGLYLAVDEMAPDISALPEVSTVGNDRVTVVVDAVALAKLMVAQRSQDFGSSWGEARDNAKAIGWSSYEEDE